MAAPRIAPRRLELLAPARDAAVGREAILHGADAVYIGPEAFGARKSAGNSISDIAGLVDFAHKYRAKVYATVNTIVYDSEISAVEKLVWDLYRAGVDALIVQDLGLLRMNLPPIALHASTQCDTRTPADARALQELGFSQIVLARELTFKEIEAVCAEVSVPVEVFVHGALCVSYSGRCHAGEAWQHRSANRGECPQVCRLPFTLADATGRVLARDKHLLSLRDFNALAHLQQLIEAGTSSFKIEGRLKDAAYVKNVVAAYSQRLQEIVEASGGKLVRASCGRCNIGFTPDLQKSFNRGFTDYFLGLRRPRSIASIHTPKSLGEPLVDVSDVHNGDGISYFDAKGKYCGVGVNSVENGKLRFARPVDIPRGAQLYRTFDREWETLMARPTATRTVAVDVRLDGAGASATDDRGVHVRIPIGYTPEPARREMNYRNIFAKTGDTIYELRDFDDEAMRRLFIPASVLTSVRRALYEALDKANEAVYPFDRRRSENMEWRFPMAEIDYRFNVANEKAAAVYSDHGTHVGQRAMETRSGGVAPGTVVMTTRHCILRELGMCKRERMPSFKEPLRLVAQGPAYSLRFDCEKCEMQVVIPENQD